MQTLGQLKVNCEDVYETKWDEIGRKVKDENKQKKNNI